MEGLTNRKLTESLCRALKDQTESSKETLRIGVCWKVRCAWDTLKSAGLHCRGAAVCRYNAHPFSVDPSGLFPMLLLCRDAML